MSKYLLLFMIFFPVDIFAMDCGESFFQDPNLVQRETPMNSEAGVGERGNYDSDAKKSTVVPRYDSQLGSDSNRGYGFEGGSSTGPNCDYAGGSSDLF